MITLRDTWGGLATPWIKPCIGGPRCGDPTVGWRRCIVQDSREISALHQAQSNRRAGGRPGDARRATPLTPRYGTSPRPFHESEALRRLHGFLASRRARRLNLRPPGAG
ncbi:hypothetical protein DZD18_07850 [Rhodobacteraceae bacterium W635]|nr:hypothetical protein DZD18_07850 [Rhodobacteraceae bacterium W635]